MTDYIDRKAALKATCAHCCNVECEDECADCIAIRKIPAADVVEVRHGEWVLTEQPMGWNDVLCVECSACGADWIMDEDCALDDYKEGWHYCPNCGAKMDGGVENG